MDQACGNCGGILRGPYCHACGEKRLGEGDRRLGHLLAQAFEVVTDVDGRLWGSLRRLLFQPGRLSRDYIDGRRRRWMTPTALFLLANVLYFVAPAMTDFNLPLHSQRQQLHSPLTGPWLEHRIAARAADGPYTIDDYARAYDAQAGDVGKALIAVHIPVLALGLMLLFRRSRLYFAEHVVVATHQFTFVLLYIQLVLLPVGWLLFTFGTGPPLAGVKTAVALPMLAYFALSLRRVYGCGWAAALLAPLVLNVFVLAANLTVYRFLQFAITFALT